MSNFLAAPAPGSLAGSRGAAGDIARSLFPDPLLYGGISEKVRQGHIQPRTNLGQGGQAGVVFACYDFA